MMIFDPWKKFLVFRDEKVTTDLMRRVAQEAEQHFKDEMMAPKSGVMYNRRGRKHRASAPGEFPANETGRLRNSIDSRYSATEAVVGSNMEYSKYLREGTRFMERRKMSDDALSEVVPGVMSTLRGWIRFKHV